ncbi:MAG: threonine synthase [Promethearchaeota archaeon]|nr:MAG: threonine synthase [Candidatus Lokiarchaeota archaeon]
MVRQEKYFFQCIKCNRRITGANDETLTCPDCGSPISVQMNIETIKEITSRKIFFNIKIKSMWSFFEFLPLLDKRNIVSIKEGNTPIVRSFRLAEKLNLKNLTLKLEYLSPTGSFKDRQISMGISKAIEMNKNAVITMSSGNVGAAVAAYSAKAGLKNLILIPSIAPESKILQIRAYGANIIRIKSDSTEFISQVVQKASKEFDMANLITAAIYNPFIIKGAKSISYEIAIQSKYENHEFPDVIIIPVGGSGLLSGVHEGFKELIELDYIDSMPKLVAVQPEGCAPFVKAIKNDLSPEFLFNNPWTDINTISTALADDIPLDCHTGIPAIKESGGYAVSVSDKETLEAEKQLGMLEGIFAEPSSCTTIAAINKLFIEDKIQEDDNIYCLITGSGFKDIKSIEPILPRIIDVEKEFNWKELFGNLL